MIELNDIPGNDKNLYEVLNLCADCGTELNRTKPMTGEELHKAWAMIAASSGLCTGQCPKKCRATFSDCNINTKLEIVKAET